MGRMYNGPHNPVAPMTYRIPEFPTSLHGEIQLNTAMSQILDPPSSALIRHDTS